MNLKDIKIDKEQVIKFGKKAGQVTKVVVMNGIKATLISVATKTISTSMDDGLEGVKQLTFDEVVGIKEKEDKPKKKKKTSKGEEIEEVLEEVVGDEPKVTVVKDEDVEVIDKK